MVDDMWEPSLGVEEASTARWVNEALDTPASDATHGFNAVVKPRVTVERVDDHVLSLSFGWLPEFDVDVEEYVHVTAPFWATQRNLSAVPGVSVTTDLNFSIGVSTPRAYAWGELVGAVVPEEALRSRSHVLHLALEGCDWPVDAGTPGSAAYAALSEALIGQTDVGAVPGESGWMMAASSLLMAQRWNATHLSLTVPPLAAYDIAAPETVEVTVPGAALLQHHEALRAIASFVVVPEGGSARLGGSLLHLNSSARASGATLAGRTLEVSLVADTFVEALRTNTSLHRRLLRGVSSRTSVEAEPYGWNAFVERALRPGENQSEAQRGTGNVSVEVSPDARLLRLTIPADDEASRYAISAPETIAMLLPAEVLTSAAAPLLASPHLRIGAAAGRATLAGNFIADRRPDTYVNETTHYTLMLTLPGWPLPGLGELDGYGAGLGWDPPDPDSDPTLTPNPNPSPNPNPNPNPKTPTLTLTPP